MCHSISLRHIQSVEKTISLIKNEVRGRASDRTRAVAFSNIALRGKGFWEFRDIELLYFYKNRLFYNPMCHTASHCGTFFMYVFTQKNEKTLAY